MGDSFAANPDLIRTAAGNFDDASDEARLVDENLQDQISGLTPIAGDDTYGAAFWKTVGPAITAGSQVLAGVRDGFTGTGTSLKFVADEYTKANDTNTDLAGNMYT
jgi:hypothetical protein